MIINMLQDEIDECIRVGTTRYRRKFGSVDRPNYAKGKENGSLEHELNASIRAAIAECAVALVTERVWGGSYTYSNRFHQYRKHLADVGEKTEVRTIRTSNAVPIWEKDKGKTIVGCEVLDLEYFTKVKIFGYVVAEDAMLPEFVDSLIEGWRYPTNLLTPIIPPPWFEVAFID
jgi:hypothetical protein